MNTKQLDLTKFDVIELNDMENSHVNGGGFFLAAGAAFLAIGAAAAAGTAIYDAGKATGEFVYHATH